MHGFWPRQIPDPVVPMSTAGSDASPASVYVFGSTSPASGSESSGRKFSIGTGVILPDVFAEYSPAMRMSAPLMRLIRNEALSAFIAALLLNLRVHIEFTITDFSKVRLMPPLIRNEGQPLRAFGHVGLKGSSNTTA